MAKSKGYVSINELAKKMGVNKSKLNYYAQLGLLKHELIAGGVKLFDEDSTLQVINKITTLKNDGKTLEEIKKEV